jgi:transposase
MERPPFSDCTHAECNCHNLRSLKDVAENYHQDWAAVMAGLLIEANCRVEELKLSGALEMPRREFPLRLEWCHKVITTTRWPS